MRAALAITLVGTMLGGCLAPAAFQCTADTQCSQSGTAGWCEAVGRCSFPDDACATGRRYGEASGAQGSQCVDGPSTVPDASEPQDAADDGTPDAALDAPGPDVPVADAPVTDAPAADAPTGCPASYAPLPGSPGHYYRTLPTAAGWTNQRAACGNEPANVYLVIPSDPAELAALVALGGGTFWVGISDAAEEGDYVTVQGADATYLPWVAGEPDNNGNQDCVRTAAATAQLETANCGTPTRAICECEP